MKPRFRQVRYSYPPELMQLAILLSEQCTKRDVSTNLAIPLSTLYRWQEIHGCHLLFECRKEKAYASREIHLEELVSACEAHGFSVRSCTAHLTSGLKPCGIDSVSHRKGQKRYGNIVCPQAARPIDVRAAFAGMSRTCATPNIGNNVSVQIRDRLQFVRDKIDSEYFTHLSCDEFGRIARMSKYNLINRFKALYGVSPYRYLLSIRIQHAKKLLGSMQESLDTVATAVGFASRSSLCKSFKSVEGISLSEFYRGLRLPSIQARPPVTVTRFGERQCYLGRNVVAPILIDRGGAIGT